LDASKAVISSLRPNKKEDTHLSGGRPFEKPASQPMICAIRMVIPAFVKFLAIHAPVTSP
jgi:hypothetical protein